MKCYLHNQMDAVGTCTRCGKAVCSECTLNVNGKIVCKQCAEQLASNPACNTAVNRKEPILSALLTLLLSGLGQIYNGQVKKGLTFLVLDILFAFVLVFLIFGGSIFMGMLTFWVGGMGACCCFPFMILPFIWKLGFIYDAYIVAEQINRGEVVGDWFQ
ncbi:hypothetical protein [Methanocella arvoryzae]|nr:hypothetical protein [Methanocella arvoryzae]